MRLSQSFFARVNALRFGAGKGRRSGLPAGKGGGRGVGAGNSVSVRGRFAASAFLGVPVFVEMFHGQVFHSLPPPRENPNPRMPSAILRKLRGVQLLEKTDVVG